MTVQEVTAIKRRFKKQAKRARTQKGYECLVCGHTSKGHGQAWRHHRDEHLGAA